MTFNGRRLMVFALAAAAGGVLAARAAVARAADADPATPATGTMTQEIVGLEFTPASIAMPSSAPAYRSGHVDTYQAGPGGSIRLLRHRWERVYVIPLEAGFYVSSGNGTIFTHLETEGGVIIPGTDRRVELGLGTGVGILAMNFSSECDGTCTMGGAGWMISLAARVLVVDRPMFTAGLGARLIVPLQTSNNDWGYNVGGGTMLLGAVEVAFGRG
jgi:hypothetical protein